jgi:hypothetical protein
MGGPVPPEYLKDGGMGFMGSLEMEAVLPRLKGALAWAVSMSVLWILSRPSCKLVSSTSRFRRSASAGAELVRGEGGPPRAQAPSMYVSAIPDLWKVWN